MHTHMLHQWKLLDLRRRLGVEIMVTWNGHFRKNSALDIDRDAFFLVKFVFLNN